jgi:hypothetical protein
MSQLARKLPRHPIGVFMERTLAISARPRQPGAFDAERIVRDVPEAAIQSLASERLKSVESRCGAVALGRTYLLPPLSSGGALVVPPWLRFHIPLIEPDRQIWRVGRWNLTAGLS